MEVGTLAEKAEGKTVRQADGCLFKEAEGEAGEHLYVRVRPNTEKYAGQMVNGRCVRPNKTSKRHPLLILVMTKRAGLNKTSL